MTAEIAGAAAPPEAKATAADAAARSSWPPAISAVMAFPV